MSYFQTDPALKNLDAYYQIEEARRTGNSAVLKDEARAIQKYMDGFVTRNDLLGWGWEKTYGPTGAFAILDHYRKNNQLLYDSFAGASTDTMIDMEPILDTLKNDTFINIIIGRPLEDFDSFVKEWHRLGGARMTEEVNEWYRNKKE